MMPILLKDLAKEVSPMNTVLLFGSGSSIPSGAPPVATLIQKFSKAFDVEADGYNLSEIASICEAKTSRRRVIDLVRELCSNLKPTGGLKNLPLYPWKSIFTTNYDDLIEQAYTGKGKKVRVYHSNFSFTTSDESEDGALFKLHGTIEHDICDGHTSRIILSEADYEQTETYRDSLYDRLKGDLAGSDLIIIGHSLADPDIKTVVNRAAAINAKILSPGRICLLMYSPDESRASLFETRGIKVTFGGIDDFFAALSSKIPKATTIAADLPILERFPVLEPVTIDVAHAAGIAADISGMFNGKSATYADVIAGHTFKRNVGDEIIRYLAGEATITVTLLGASGVGKTTAIRQTLSALRSAGYLCFEHKGDHTLNFQKWCDIAQELKDKQELGALFIDDAHRHLQEVNDLIDLLVQFDNPHLKVVLSSSKNHWYPRIKTPNMYRYGRTFTISKLAPDEIEALLTLIDTNKDVRGLVEDQFEGFNREERRRRLAIRCEADMFVCLKNIFANDNFDDIMLKEYADLAQPLQDIYRNVAAMETAGIRVHRQLIIRLLGINAASVSPILDNLTDIITEYDLDERKGIFGWRCRHPVIAGIVTKYKFSDLDKTIALFESVIQNISPTYDVEIRSLRELCNVETGIARIPDKSVQNRLLRMMMSNAPGERVPRHRLIRNLIDQGLFEKAETEIRLFNKDFGRDGPVHRYKIKLLVQRAVRSPGLLDEDRIAILEEAHSLAVQGVSRYPINKNILSAYAELGIEYYRKTGSYAFFDEAIARAYCRRGKAW
jgi:SIR2-like domain